MESSDASWHSFDPSVTMEDSEAMAQLLGMQYFGNEQKQSTMYWPGQDADQYCGSAPYYMQHLNSGASYDEHGYYGAGTVTMTGDFFVPGEEMADPSFMLDLNLDFDDQDGGGKPPACKRKLELEQKDESTTGTVPIRKKGRSMAMPAPKKGKTAQSKKAAQKGACSIQGNQEESNGNLQSSSNNYLSDDDSQEMTVCSNVSSASKKSSSSSGRAKARAERGAATDPQSLYARKRRERINERLKVLQNLVPNGTKVDISTMLEEAVQYVKFLQLQIKLLSSDDLWMFAPIAYNGVNVGLDLKISPPQQ
ncbi:hypothetical protein PR202_gb18955 [Eleusine coracana subsp. coracana]|uniref:BHLH domain-containing protein n=1 Tax=Eleusine coracana subsp. coracana TaxID=191504 RepID=A0AAV5F706_ELECO|nr:hypothetical protein QOZ80_3BG0290080 [Eleusine coracana subsp. coracana]GJN30633.1 hypothetical protein PR202_gb18955 [Eleusine coracana subsp. coracana]